MEEWQNPKTITTWIVISIVFLLILLSFIVLLVRTIFQKIVKTKLAESKAKLEHQQILLNTTIQTQEKERKRIAADLHDDLIGKLTSIKLQQEVTSHTNTESVLLLTESINTARRICHDLSPPLLEYSLLPDLIKEIINPLKNKIQVNYYFDIRTKEDNHSNEFKIQLIRIVQEIVTNIEKHAKASIIDIHYRHSNNYIILKVKDDGTGYNSITQQKGLGLKNIETRVYYLKGKFRLQSELNKGTTSLFLFKSL